MEQPEQGRRGAERRGTERDGSERADPSNAEREAVERATSEVLGDGTRRDAHGEITPDPYPAGDEDRPDPDVLEDHLADVEAVEQPPGVGHRAADPQGMQIDDGEAPDDEPPASGHT